MNYIEDLFKKNKCELVLTILFILYLIIGSEDNIKLAQIVDIPQIKAAIIIISFLLFVYCNKILGILGIFVAYEILNFSHVMIKDSIIDENDFEDSGDRWKNVISGLNSFEEEIIFKMMPCVGINSTPCSYKPLAAYNNVFSF